MHKLTWVNNNLEYLWLEDFGNCNKMPTPFMEIPAGEFWYLYTFYSPEYLEFRQVYDLVPKEMRTVHIYWYHQYALCIQSPTKWDFRRNGENCPTYFVDKPKFYRIGCNHSFKELSPKEANEKGVSHFGMCYHVYECINCQYIKSEDSSD